MTPGRKNLSKVLYRLDGRERTRSHLDITVQNSLLPLESGSDR